MSDKGAIIPPRVSGTKVTSKAWLFVMMYAELTGNRKKQRIKSLCDNKLHSLSTDTGQAKTSPSG